MIRVLVVTAMYPQPSDAGQGIFVYDQVQALRRLGLQVDVLYVDGRRSRRNYLLGCVRVFNATRGTAYDVVHGHYGYAGLMARCQRRARTVITLHGSDVNLRSQRPFAQLAAALADATIVVSPELARLAHVPRAAVIPCGVDLDLFQPGDRTRARRELGLDPERPVIVFPSHPSRRVKRYDRFLAAIALLRTSVQAVTLENVPHERVPLVLNAADCVVLTSDSEGSPMVVREALACNTPVVSVDVGDVQHQLAGVTPGGVVGKSPAELAAAVDAVLQTGSRSNGRAHAIRYDLEATAREVVAVYVRVIGKAAGLAAAGARP